MDCVHDYFASSSGRCWPCQDSNVALSWRVGAAAVCIAAAIALAAASFWHRPADGVPVGFTGADHLRNRSGGMIGVGECAMLST